MIAQGTRTQTAALEARRPTSGDRFLHRQVPGAGTKIDGPGSMHGVVTATCRMGARGDHAVRSVAGADKFLHLYRLPLLYTRLDSHPASDVVYGPFSSGSFPYVSLPRTILSPPFFISTSASFPFPLLFTSPLQDSFFLVLPSRFCFLFHAFTPFSTRLFSPLTSPISDLHYPLSLFSFFLPPLSLGWQLCRCEQAASGGGYYETSEPDRSSQRYDGDGSVAESVGSIPGTNPAPV